VHPARAGRRGVARGLRLRRLLLQLVPPEDRAAEPDQRIEPPVDDPLLHRNDRVIGDFNAFRADLGAALGDVAVADALGVAGVLDPVGPGVQRVHVQFGGADEHPWPGEGRLVLLVVADHVAYRLAQEALDALAELLRAAHVDLLHPVLTRGHARRWREGRGLAGL